MIAREPHASKPEVELPPTARVRGQDRRDLVGALCSLGFLVALVAGVWLAQVSRTAALVVVLLALVPGWWGVRYLVTVGLRE